MIRVDLGETHYDVLGVPEDVSFEEVRRLRRQLGRRYHPDTGSEPDGERMAKINDACDTLGDERKRENYDDILKLARARESERKRNEREEREQRKRASRVTDDDVQSFEDRFTGQRSRRRARASARRSRPKSAQSTGARRAPGSRPRAPRSAPSARPPAHASGGLSGTALFWLLVLAIGFAVLSSSGDDDKSSRSATAAIAAQPDPAQRALSRHRRDRIRIVKAMRSERTAWRTTPYPPDCRRSRVLSTLEDGIRDASRLMLEEGTYKTPPPRTELRSSVAWLESWRRVRAEIARDPAGYKRRAGRFKPDYACADWDERIVSPPRHRVEVPVVPDPLRRG